MPPTGWSPARVAPRAHAHLSRADRRAASGWRASRVGCATRRRRAPISRPWATGSRSSRPRRRRRADSRRAAARSRFSRRAAGDPTEEQVVAANIDTVFLVSGLDGDFNPRRIERYLLVAADSGATPVIVLNKADLVEDCRRRWRDSHARWPPGVAVHAVSCRRPESLDVLRALSRPRPDRRAARVVGRGQVDHRQPARRPRPARARATCALSDSRGRHTSTARQLVMLPGERRAHRYARHARAAAVGRRRGGRRHVRRHRGARAPAAAFATASTDQSPAARCAPRSTAGELSASRLESFHKLPASRPIRRGSRTSARSIDEKRRGKIGAEGAAQAAQGQGPLARTSAVHSSRHSRSPPPFTGSAGTPSAASPA